MWVRLQLDLLATPTPVNAALLGSEAVLWAQAHPDWRGLIAHISAELLLSDVHSGTFDTAKNKLDFGDQDALRRPGSQ